jgi:hypothetical protein
MRLNLKEPRYKNKSGLNECCPYKKTRTIKLIIKEMRTISFLLVILLKTLNPLSAQSLASTEPYQETPFAQQLIVLTDKDSLNHALLEIASIKKRIAQSTTTEPMFVLSDRWKLIYFEKEGGEDAGGRKTQTHITCINHKNNETYSGAEIFKKFKISDTLSKKGFPLKTIPLVFERDDAFNMKWTPVYTTRDYLIMRYVHSYPYGNYTSWYYETIYYFKRAD